MLTRIKDAAEYVWVCLQILAFVVVGIAPAVAFVAAVVYIVHDRVVNGPVLIFTYVG